MGHARRESDSPSDSWESSSDATGVHEHARGERADDDTVQTILARASRRARKVEQLCHTAHPDGLRRPMGGRVERVDPERLAHVKPAPHYEEGDEDWTALPIFLRH